MNKSELISTVSGKTSRILFSLQKKSPEILVVAGVVGVVGTVISACKATTKLESVLEKPKKEIAEVHELMNNKEYQESGEYTAKDGQKDLIILYTKTGVQLIKLYGPTVLLGVASIASILASNSIMRKRSAALVAAYKAVDSGFKEYRQRVIDRFGKDVEQELSYDIKAQKFEGTKVDEKTGKEKKTVEKVDVSGIPGYSIYARFFDENCTAFEKSPEYNLMYAKCQQQAANDILHARGHIFLNEVYDMFGIPRTKAGQVVGWIYDESRDDIDNYVDFGLYDVNKPKSRDFVNGYEKAVLLDFNVDGPIIDEI